MDAVGDRCLSGYRRYHRASRDAGSRIGRRGDRATNQYSDRAGYEWSAGTKRNGVAKELSFGLSIGRIGFDDGIEDYWARQRVQERLVDVELPYNAVPGLNPLTSPTGEIFRYVVESDRLDLRELTDLHKWVIIPRLKQVTGVADVSNYGGITTQYQIEVNPYKMEQYDITLGDITEKIEKNNVNAGGSMLSRGDLSYVIRGIGLVKDLEDLGHIVIKTVNGVPVYLNDIGKLKYGNLERKGVLGFTDDTRDYSDGVEGIVQMLRGENPSRVLDDVHKAVDELNNETLPEGIRIHPFMDRTDLVNTTLHTVSHTLFEGMVLVVLVLILFLGSWRGACVLHPVSIDCLYLDACYEYSCEPTFLRRYSTSVFW